MDFLKHNRGAFARILSRKKLRYESESTWHSTSDTIFTESEVDSLQPVPVDSPTRATTRAMAALKIRPRQQAGVCFRESESECPPSSSEAANSPPLRIHCQDIFNKDLNQCSQDNLRNLRLQRERTAPIVCYESDSSDHDGEFVVESIHSSIKLQQQEETNTEMDFALQSRLEVLQTQRQLLGENHPDVLFLANHIRQLRRRKASLSS
jgi:hypothetical protein